jgi:hypothetical protein
MGCFATGITIVTALDPAGQPIGLTANSFTSLSLDPPLLLLCIANNAGSAPVLREAPHFGVNVLQISQQPASNRFAGKGEDRFAATAWAPGETGVPLLADSARSNAAVMQFTTAAITSFWSVKWSAPSTNRAAIRCSISVASTGGYTSPDGARLYCVLRCHTLARSVRESGDERRQASSWWRHEPGRDRGADRAAVLRQCPQLC